MSGGARAFLKRSVIGTELACVWDCGGVLHYIRPSRDSGYLLLLRAIRHEPRSYWGVDDN